MLTTDAVFLEKTSLLVDVLVGAVLAEKPHVLTQAQVTWFAACCDQRFRYFHANRPDWRKWLEDRDPKIDPRDQCKAWIRHWLAAYVLDPAGYQHRCATCPACGNALERQENCRDGFVWRECAACGFKGAAEKSALRPWLTYLPWHTTVVGASNRVPERHIPRIGNHPGRPPLLAGE